MAHLSRHYRVFPPAIIVLTIWITLVIILGPLLVSGISAAPGDTFVWELRNSRSETGYVKGTYIGIQGGEVYINYTSYDILGDQDVAIPNKTAGYFWEDPAKFDGWRAEGYGTANVSQLDQTFFCVIRVRYYDYVNTSDYFDFESGILVKSESDNGQSMVLISIGDLDVKAYVESQGRGIPGFPVSIVALTGLSTLGWAVYRTRRQRLNSLLRR